MFKALLIIILNSLGFASASPFCSDLHPLTLQQVNLVTTTLGQNIALTPEQLLRIEQLTTAFENSDIAFHYDYIENIHDGRGFTAGRVGFCSGTGDMVEVVEAYEKLHPNNGLSKYLRELRRLNNVSGAAAAKTSGLPGFEAAWKKACDDPLFRKAQDDEIENVYLKPALSEAKKIGLTTPLSKGFLYDTIIQHGDGPDPDSLKTLIKETTAAMRGTPSTGISEKDWITKFMEVRRADLAHCSNVASRKEWAESVDRVDSYKRIMATGNWNLDGPIHFTAYGGSFIAP